MPELKYPWKIMHAGTVEIWSGETLEGAKAGLAYFLRYPNTYTNPRIVKVGIVDNDPVVETKTEIVRYSYVYRPKGGPRWWASGLWELRSDCEGSRAALLMDKGYEAGDVTETKYTITTTEKVNK